jgi:hypothetical protein
MIRLFMAMGSKETVSKTLFSEWRQGNLYLNEGELRPFFSVSRTQWTAKTQLKNYSRVNVHKPSGKGAATCAMVSETFLLCLFTNEQQGNDKLYGTSQLNVGKAGGKGAVT